MKHIYNRRNTEKEELYGTKKIIQICNKPQDLRCIWSLGEYFNIDPTLIRLGGVLLACVSCGTAWLPILLQQLSFRIRNKKIRELCR